MTNVIHLAGRRAGIRVQLFAPAPAPAIDKAAGIARQAAIENALSMALHHIRMSESPGNIHTATVRAVRAAAMLKQACTEAATRRNNACESANLQAMEG